MRKRMNTRVPASKNEARARMLFGEKGFDLFDLIESVGRGFLALKLDVGQTSGAIVRRKKYRKLELHWLEHPPYISPSDRAYIVSRMGPSLIEHEFPLSVTQPGGPYLWYHLVPRHQIEALSPPYIPIEFRKVDRRK